MHPPYKGLDGMLLERNGKLTVWKSKSSCLSYSLVESLPPHKYLMPVMIDFFPNKMALELCKTKRLHGYKTTIIYETALLSGVIIERKSIIFALSATLASFRLMTCFIQNETAITFV